MADSEFPRTIRRWISSTEGEPDEDDFETLHAMLEASGWLPPQDLNVSLERPIRKLEKRKQHHVEMIGFQTPKRALDGPGDQFRRPFLPLEPFDVASAF